MRVGIDILEVARMEKYYKKEGFMTRVFGEQELEYFKNKGNDFQNLAGYYCVKEAFFKAIGTGILLSMLKHVQVTHDELGAPKLLINDELKKKYNITWASISITHSATTAVAICILNA